MATNNSIFKLLGNCIAFLIGLTLITSHICYGYIMPAEQLLEFMTKNFSNFKTVLITQSTLQKRPDGERFFTEQIRMKSPDLFDLKVLDRVEERVELPDMAYRQLLIANSSWRLEQILSMMGINLQAVAFTRIDGIIAYRIGEKESYRPKLLIEKERFLPMLLIYNSREDLSENMVTVRFQDYRKQDEGWYPFEITYDLGDKIREQYTVQSFQSNEPVDPSLLQTLDIKPYQSHVPEKGLSDVEEERLRDIIKAFEEKYQ